ncbi:MAG TPA: protein kinase [Terriglobales bacterium]|nr:protein kinase [Terriglobales bacterium]
MANEAARAEWTPERWRQVREVLATLIETPDHDREALLLRACGEDNALRFQVEELLQAHEASEAGGLDRPALSHDPGIAAMRAFGQLDGQRMGAYRVEAEIAHGGMGTVYRAVRADEAYEKRVAIKVVDRGVLSRRSTELFRHERQILANLEHPNIARLLDGGTREDGSPYLVMEYVEGETITKYCDAHRLSIEHRLELFQKICSAVHFAHQNLIIHRDIKPANILVTSEGEPKLLDFGIAKIVNDSAAEMTQTLGAMTPAYASPEQLCGHPVTTATDIYSLGLVLYELLTGRYAYERFSSPAQRQQAILESDPDRPSRVVFRETPEPCETPNAEQICALRQLSPEKLAKRLEGDLESIVVKAIRKEPEQRYSSVAQFSEDISLHLQGKPVIAHQSTLLYRGRKFIRRHKFAVATGALVLGLIASGLVLIVRAERLARAEQAEAERRFNDVRKLANSLIFEVHDSIQSLPGATAAKKLIAQRAQQYLDSLAAGSRSDPTLLRELAGAYRRLASAMGDILDANTGESAGALRNFERAAELREAVVRLMPSNVDARWELAQSYLDLGHIIADTSEKAKSQEYVEKALAILEPLAAANPQNPKVQYELAKGLERKAGALAEQGKIEEARVNYEKSLPIYQRLMNGDPKNQDYRTEVAFAHKHLGGLLATEHQREKLLEGLAHYRAALVIDEGLLKEDPQNARKRYAITFTYSDIGYITGNLGDIDGALGFYRKVFDIRSALVREDPQDTRARSGLSNTYDYMSGLLEKKGQLQEALADQNQAFQIRKALADSDPANDSKRLRAAMSEAKLGQAYVTLAFDTHKGAQQRSSFCRQAEAYLQHAIPELMKHSSELVRSEASFIEESKKAADHCRSVSTPRHASLRVGLPIH